MTNTSDEGGGDHDHDDEGGNHDSSGRTIIIPSSHTYPSSPFHRGKYVTKSYYDMTQPPRYS